MLIILVTYKLKSRELRDAFYGEVCVSGAPDYSRAEPGNRLYEYYYPVDKEDTIFLLEKWKDLEAHQYHSVQPYFLKLQAIKEKYGAETSVEKYIVE